MAKPDLVFVTAENAAAIEAQARAVSGELAIGTPEDDV